MCLGETRAFLRETGGLDAERSVQQGATTLHIISLLQIHAQSRVSALTGVNMSFLSFHLAEISLKSAKLTSRESATEDEILARKTMAKVLKGFHYCISYLIDTQDRPDRGR
jgi:hypothetical protein